MARSIVKFLPVLILLIGLVAFFYFGLQRYVTLQALQSHRALLLQWSEEHAFLLTIGFILTYAVAVAISMPNAVILTIMSGFIFGRLLGTLSVVIGATIGATLIFLAARTAFHDLLYAKSKPWLDKLAKGFQRNEISYMLFLRLVPLFPFWLVNIVPAFFGVRLRNYIITTFFGIIPGTFVYAALGHGIGTLLDKNEVINLLIIFKPSILVPIMGLAILSLIPIVYQRLKQKRE